MGYVKVFLGYWLIVGILRFVSNSFFFLPKLIYLLIWFVKATMELSKEKDKDSLRLKLYFWGLRLFCDRECFPKPVELIMLPPDKALEEHDRIILG